jgi:hypothetical protein
MDHTCSNANGSIGCEVCWQELQAEIAKLRPEVEHRRAQYEQMEHDLHAANIQVDEIRKERDGFRVGYLRHRLSLEEASKRWCWCKQEEIPGNCAKCVAEIALRPVVEKPKSECTCASTGSHAVFCALSEKPNCACPPDRQGHYPSCGTTVIIIPAVAEKRIADGATCPACGLGVTGVDPLCEKHYSEYLGQNRARGNNEDD